MTGETPEGVSRAEVSRAATRAVMKAEVKEAAVKVMAVVGREAEVEVGKARVVVVREGWAVRTGVAARVAVMVVAAKVVGRAAVRRAAVRAVIKARSNGQTASMPSMPLETIDNLRLMPWRSRRTRGMLVSSRRWVVDCKASRAAAVRAVVRAEAARVAVMVAV